MIEDIQHYYRDKYIDLHKGEESEVQASLAKLDWNNCKIFINDVDDSEADYTEILRHTIQFLATVKKIFIDVYD